MTAVDFERETFSFKHHLEKKLCVVRRSKKRDVKEDRQNEKENGRKEVREEERGQEKKESMMTTKYDGVEWIPFKN